MHLDVVQDGLLIGDCELGDFAVGLDCFHEAFGDSISVESCNVFDSSHNVSGEMLVEFLSTVHHVTVDS